MRSFLLTTEVWGLRGFLRRSHTTDGLGGVPPPPTFNNKEMNMEYELKHGQAMVITGPQGCGKSTLARKIAAQHGTFAEIDAHELGTRFGLGYALDSEPDTLVVEGFPSTEETLAEIKAALTSSTVICHRKYKEPKAVKTPNFIFCSGDENALHLDAQDRRFFVVRLGDNS